VKYELLAIPDVILFEPQVYSDQRGSFFESYNQQSFENALGKEIKFFQDNQSRSAPGVVRGLHYQLDPMAQGKLVRVVSGSVFDVAVDLRRNSSTFGKWVGEILSADNKKQLWIPAGFAHGFMALSEGAEFLYKATAPYSAELERCILWNDPTVDINWPQQIEPIISPKDAAGQSWSDAEFFE